MEFIAPRSARSRYHFVRARAKVFNLLDRWRDPDALAFYSALDGRGFRPDALINVIPRHRLIYVSVPKCASTTIAALLTALSGRSIESTALLHRRRHTELLSPLQVGLSLFHRIATNPATLRFAFVRNPFSRLVSAWADKFHGKPLIAGDPFVEQYLALRPAIDTSLPAGPFRILSFPDFVIYATATAAARVDAHWSLQSDILDLPRIPLDLIGKIETFGQDIVRVLDHVGAPAPVRQAAAIARNPSSHGPWPSYYTPGLAERVYRTYEADFDAYSYARHLTDESHHPGVATPARRASTA